MDKLKEKIQKEKLSPMERHFLRWYNENRNSFSMKFHRKLRPNCIRCKSDDILYNELKYKMENGTN